MDFEQEFELEHLLFKQRRCRSCGVVKDLVTDFIELERVEQRHRTMHMSAKNVL